jgi:hypothetical protein
MKPFQCSIDKWGDITCQAGRVINGREGQIFTVADRATGTVGQALPDANGSREFTTAGTSVFLGGSGRNLKLETTAGSAVPKGLFSPTTQNVWRGVLFPKMILTYTASTSTVTLHDGTNTVASGTGFSTSPAGTLTLTSYGQTTYNGGAAGTITIALQGTYPATIPGCMMNPTTALIAADTFTAVGSENYAASTLTGWTLSLNTLGYSSYITDGTDIVATRSAGTYPWDPVLAYDPTGIYTSTSYGQATWGVGGTDPFMIYVQLQTQAPLVGYVYVKIVESAPGVISTVTGPFFATTLPTTTYPNFYMPIAYSDGAGKIEQIQEGPILWGAAFGAAIVQIGLADFEALGTPTAGTFYAITGP